MNTTNPHFAALTELLTNHWAPGFRAKRTRLEEDGTLPAADASLEEWLQLWKKIPPQDKALAEDALRLSMLVGVALWSKGNGPVGGKLRELVKQAGWAAPNVASQCDLACRVRATYDALDHMKGNSDAMRRVREETWRAAFGRNLIQAAAAQELLRNTPVLICGETGTGKELVARALAYSVPGRWDPVNGSWEKPGFVATHLAALPETLVHDELFGHKKGAYSDAKQDRPGVFERSKHGVVFLDEVGELPETTQVALLRVLQEKKVSRLGSEEPIDVSPRVISATNREIDQQVRKRHFREDLMHRLSSVVVELPPLRDRPDDILELVQYEVDQLGGMKSGLSPKDISDELERISKGHDWGGNVRELNAAVRSIALGIKPRLRSCAAPVTRSVPVEIEKKEWTLQKLQRWYATSVRDQAGSDVEAARRLGVHRQTLKRYLEPAEGEETYD